MIAATETHYFHTVDAIWARVDGSRARWRTPAERDTFKAAIDRARSVYLEIAARPR